MFSKFDRDKDGRMDLQEYTVFGQTIGEERMNPQAWQQVVLFTGQTGKSCKIILFGTNY